MEVLGQSGTTNFAKSGIFRARQLVTDGRDYGGSRPVRRGLFCQVSRSLGSWPLVKAGSEDTGLGATWLLSRVDSYSWEELITLTRGVWINWLRPNLNGKSFTAFQGKE
ncbi:hypothetical protein KQX54_005482 [Cotesia glomerata]|uniref:Uncharacterized protein n=1 Tax=Cotesia glomerata TaxID=32391 RepID=A0AAV7IZG6_COTGL|nr:hypothetical protein KQX54_005482 [Cotesia glomerata]